ncbi:MAG: hypothetical protein DDT28_00507 [Dehalococcoidia bacterium]|nr:hypothetical protein [Chloroflexota bacterium]
MKKGFVVDKLRGVVLVKLLKVEKYLLFDILNQVYVVPKLIKPRLQVASITVAVHFQVKLDVVAGGT